MNIPVGEPTHVQMLHELIGFAANLLQEIASEFPLLLPKSVVLHKQQHTQRIFTNGAWEGSCACNLTPYFVKLERSNMLITKIIEVFFSWTNFAGVQGEYTIQKELHRSTLILIYGCLILVGTGFAPHSPPRG
ncbi:uncharacterized protein LOC129894385 isoform X2 [Solanum dulcamara]|uniref:uncharacterized protein LOC129894385 isoform X2 n=1 Tax=Solanum dulcamara TaxID=45834 RepID=UPI0024855437|nr:uncharacterized protein LOC129894385 isoform X2 [Solanum dulcamara]